MISTSSTHTHRLKYLLVAAASAALSGCMPTRPPVVTPPTPPALSVETEATIYPSAGALVDAVVVATPDNGLGVNCPVDTGDNRFHCTLPPGTSRGAITITAPHFQLYSQPVGFPLTEDITLIADRIELPRIGRRGPAKFFGTGGIPYGGGWTPVMVLEAVEFDLFEQFVHQGDRAVRPVLEQVSGDHYNMILVFTAFNVCPDGHSTVNGSVCQKIGRLVPAESPDLYAKAIDFIDLASIYGLHVHFVAWTGPYGGVLEGDAAKIDHYNQLCAALGQRPNNTVLTLINEADNGPNSGAPVGSVTACPGVFSSHGSNSGDEEPVQTNWDFLELHVGAGLSGEWQRRPGHDAMDLANKYGGPVAITEMMRTDSDTSSTAVQHYYDTGRASAMLNGWIICHSPEGKAGVPWGADSEAKCKALAEGARSMDLSCQDGPYSNNESAVGVIREYHRGSRPECTATIH